MAHAFWCIVEDDRKGSPKKVMAEVIGEAARLAGGNVEAVWITGKATDEGLKQLGAWGATKVWLLENAAFEPYRGEVWTPVLAELVTHGEFETVTPAFVLALLLLGSNALTRIVCGPPGTCVVSQL